MIGSETQTILTIKNISVKRQANTVLNGINLTINKGENLFLTGYSGSGKTTLIEAISKQLLYSGAINIHYNNNSPLTPRLLMLREHNQFKNLSNTSDVYYQQRYNVYESGDARTVAEELQALQQKHTNNTLSITDILQQLRLEHRKDATLLMLSSGEQKRFQFAKALIIRPQLLLLDNPLTSIDSAGRKTICSIIDEIAALGTTIIMTGKAGTELPECISHFVVLKNGSIENIGSIAELAGFKDEESSIKQLQIPTAKTSNHYRKLVSLKDVFVNVGDKVLLENINWEIVPGEHWHLKGENGSGKSTLLSLLTGDNPQAYASDIILFDKKRGSGESIWEIKKKIGYLSPELHRHFPKQLPIWQVVASGLFDTSGLYQKLKVEQQTKVNDWLQAFGWYESRKEPLSHLSSGMQRLVMLIRSLIKNPPLMILDEPCQGMDSAQQKQFIATLDGIMQTGDQSLIYVTHNEDELPECINRRITLANKTSSTINVKN